MGALLVCGFALAVMALRPAPAQACPKNGPCSSGTIHHVCPNTANGSTAGFNASFNVPKGARNLRYTVVDADDPDIEYGASNPICGGTSLSTTDQLTPGTTEDTYEVTVTSTSTGGANPGESHDVIVKADWDLEADLHMTKVLVGGGDSIDAEEQVIFRIVVHNYGPEEARSIRVFDEFRSLPDHAYGGFTVTAVEQVAGPQATDGPHIVSPGNGVVGFWKKLPVGGDIVILVYGHANKAGKVQNAGNAHQETGGNRVEPGPPDPHPNFISHSFDVNPVPDSNIKGAGATGAAGTASGAPAQPLSWPPHARASASGVKRVEVAILRLGGGRPFTQLPAKPTKKPGKCKWLKSASGRFKGRKPQKRVCDSPVWLNAKGTAHWHLVLHGLPPGRYVFYSRAVGPGGASEGTFSAKDKNRKTFRVG